MAHPLNKAAWGKPLGLLVILLAGIPWIYSVPKAAEDEVMVIAKEAGVARRFESHRPDFRVAFEDQPLPCNDPTRGLPLVLTMEEAHGGRQSAVFAGAREGESCRHYLTHKEERVVPMRRGVTYYSPAYDHSTVIALIVTGKGKAFLDDFRFTKSDESRNGKDETERGSTTGVPSAVADPAK